MAEKEVNIKISAETGEIEGSLGHLEKQFENLNEEIRKVPQGSEDFKKLQKQLTATGREIKNVELAFESLDNEQVASEIGSVAGAVGDVSAAFILLGDDSEEMQEVAKNIEQALGVSMAFKGAIEGVSSARKLLNNSTLVSNTLEKISNFIKGESAVASTAAAAGEGARATATAGATAATSASTGALKLFRLALVATGIGAIVVGLGLLIANFDKVKAAVMEAVHWLQDMYYKFQNLGTGVKIAISIMLPIIGIIYGIAEGLEYLGIIESEEENQARKLAEAKEKAAKAKLKAIREELQAKIDAYDEEIKALHKLTKEITDQIDWEIEKRKAAGEDVAELEEEKINVLIESYRKEVDLIKQKMLLKAEEIKQIEESDKKYKLLSTKSAEKDLERLEDDHEDKLELLDEQLKALELFHIKEDKENREAWKKKQEEKEKQQKEELKALKEHMDNIEKVRRRSSEIVQEEAEKEKTYWISTYADVMAAQIELEHQATEQRRKEREERLDNAESLVSALDNLNQKSLEAQLNMAGDNEEKKNEIRKKAFARDKALKLAQATIDGIRSVQAALTIPPPLGFALAAINGATAAAQIAAIASAKFEGETGDSAGGNLPNTSRATGGANIGQVQNTTTVIGEPTKVFVTEQDISDTQGRVRVAESQASL